MSEMMSKVAHLRQQFPTLDIEVDGGVGPSTIDECAQVRLMFDEFVGLGSYYCLLCIKANI